jgi:DNA-binding GntR family transcriptional regulator
MTDKKNAIIDTTNINEKVYQLIKHRILYYEYPPGYKLNIRGLQQDLGVSNSPIKDALFKLAGEDFVEITSRQGTFVKDITEEDIWEIEQARIVLESGAVEIVAPKIMEKQLEHLESLYIDTLMRGEKFDYVVFMKKDLAFHLEIMRLTGNKRLLDMFERLNAHLQIARFQIARQVTKRLPWTNSDHRKIIKALRDKNPQMAKQIVTEHRIKARDAFLSRCNKVKNHET